MPQRLTESQTLTVTEAAQDSPGRLQIGLITPGWGSSGYYSPKVLENAATAKVFAKGTKMFLDHPGETERRDRPERSVRDLAAVLTEDARWDGSGLVAEAKIIGPYKELLTDETFAQNVGVSIAAYAETTIGEAEGRKGTLVTELTEAFSVDFVTFPGRGGAVLSVLESARRGVVEATVEDMNRALRDALKGAYGADNTYVWVRDFDPDAGLVWFTVEDADSMTTYQQGYTLDDTGAATLADGDPAEVRARTEYVLVTASTEAHEPPVAPAGSTPIHESEEDTMSTTTIEEARLRQLEADAGRVQTLESERDTARTERDEARAALAARDRTDEARSIIATQAREAGVAFTTLEERGLLATLPVTDDALDADAFTQSVVEAAAEKAAAAGAGRIHGFGTITDTTTTDVIAAAERAAATAFGRTVKEA